MNYTSNQSSKSLKSKVEELKTTNNLINWINNSNIVLVDSTNHKNLPLSQYYTNYLMNNNGVGPTKEDIVNLLEEIIEFKDNYKNDKKKFLKDNINILGGLYGYVNRGDEIKLNTSLWTKPNKHDYDLFSNFRQCGKSIVLLDGQGNVLLCKEDSYGRVRISNEEFLKGAVGRTVNELFDIKIRMYLKKLNQFLIDLDDMTPEECGLSPIEDWIEMNVPTTMMKIFRIFEYQERKEVNGNDITITYRRASLRQELKNDFDGIFNWVLEHWTDFKKCITGQSEIYAWSNDRSITSFNYWDLPESCPELPDIWNKFLSDKFTNEHLRKRFMTYIGMCMDANNRCQQYLVISDKGGTGKDFFGRILKNSLPRYAINNLDSSYLRDEDRFGLSNCKIWQTHISILSEIRDSRYIQTDKAKKFFANNVMDLEVKNMQSIEWNPINHKSLIFTNERITIKDEANRRRAIPIVFEHKLQYSQEYEDELTNTCKDFLNHCYFIYKNNPLVINGQLLVLTKEDEDKFLNGELTYDEINDKWNTYSKAAFNEDCLKDYYFSDNYEDSLFNVEFAYPFIDKYFEITNDSTDIITYKEFYDSLKDFLEINDSFNDLFTVKYIRNELYIPNRSKGITYIKNLLKDEFDIINKNIKIDGKVTNGFKGIKLKQVKTTKKEDSLYNYDKATSFLESIADETKDNYVEEDVDSFFSGFGLKNKENVKEDFE